MLCYSNKNRIVTKARGKESMEASTQYRDGSTLFGLITGLREDVRNLFQEEVQLAKTEMAEKASYFGRNAVYLGIGGVIAYLALIFLLLALSFLAAFGFEALGLTTGIALFLGFIATALICGIVGGILVMKALKAFKTQSLVPEKTIETLKEIKGGGLEQSRVPIKVYQPPTPEDNRSSEEIRTDLERTRSRIGREVRGIRTRLGFANLAVMAADCVSRNPVRSVGFGVAGFVLMRVARMIGRRGHA